MSFGRVTQWTSFYSQQSSKIESRTRIKSTTVMQKSCNKNNNNKIVDIGKAADSKKMTTNTTCTIKCTKHWKQEEESERGEEREMKTLSVEQPSSKYKKNEFDAVFFRSFFYLFQFVYAFYHLAFIVVCSYCELQNYKRPVGVVVLLFICPRVCVSVFIPNI